MGFTDGYVQTGPRTVQLCPNLSKKTHSQYILINRYIYICKTVHTFIANHQTRAANNSKHTWQNLFISASSLLSFVVSPKPHGYGTVVSKLDLETLQGIYI